MNREPKSVLLGTNNRGTTTKLLPMLPKLESLPTLKDKLLQEVKQIMMLAPMFNSRLLAPNNSQVNKLYCHHHRPTLCPQQELESVPP